MTDWPAIIRDHGPLVWRTAYRLLANDADASDCFQQTFLSAVQLDRKQPVTHWPAALIKIATARSLDRLRERYRTSKRFEALPEDQPDRRVDDAIDHAAGAELSDRLRRALSTLDPPLADVFCLISLEGYSYAEAASQMNVTTNHAGVLLSRAKAALREKLITFAPAPKGVPS